MGLERLRDAVTAEARVFVSGGADGADLEWTWAAARRAEAVVIVSFSGHNMRIPHCQHSIVRVGDADLDELYERVQPIMRRMNRTREPGGRYVQSLLARDVALADVCDHLFAVGMRTVGGGGLGIEGGTAYACEAFHARGKAFVFFDQHSKRWYDVGADGAWTPAARTPVIPETGAIGVVGTRRISPEGKDAIADVMHGVH